MTNIKTFTKSFWQFVQKKGREGKEEIKKTRMAIAKLFALNINATI